MEVGLTDGGNPVVLRAEGGPRWLDDEGNATLAGVYFGRTPGQPSKSLAVRLGMEMLPNPGDDYWEKARNELLAKFNEFSDYNS